MRLLKVSAGVVIALASARTGYAELPVSSLSEIYQSYNDCFQVATSDGLKSEALAALGWARATVSKNGKQVPSDLPIYGHKTRAPIIMLSAAEGSGLCIVMARIDSLQDFEKFKSAWGGKLPKPSADGTIGFLAEGRPVQLRQTGSPEKPSLSIAVMTPMGAK